MNFDYRFPLFEGLIQGSLNPLSAQNAATADYPLRLSEQIVPATFNEGIYTVRFSKPTHPKQQYYLNILLSETYAYCNEMIEYLRLETNTNIRAYLRDKILDKHLTTCLKRLGVLIDAANLPVGMVKDPQLVHHPDDFYNAWILHLFKVCLAKAYLEVQIALADVVSVLQTETMLYSGYLHELSPVQTFLVRNKVPEKAEKSNYKPDTAEKTVVAAPEINSPTEKSAEEIGEFMLVKEAAGILRTGTRTVLRRIENHEIKAHKANGQWLIDKAAFKEYLSKL